MSDSLNEMPLGNSDGVDKNECPLSGVAVKKIEKRICGDIWLAVFNFLCCAQLGLEIAPINRRFDHLVDVHFKTRHWTLMGFLRIRGKADKNGTKQMEIVNSYGKLLPIAQNPPPKKVIGFRRIAIAYIDQNVIAFLQHFRSLFINCGINLAFLEHEHRSNHFMQFIVLNIWPMIKDNIHDIRLWPNDLRKLRQFAPSILSDCPSLRYFFVEFFPTFPPDESANASDGQALAKWLLTPRPDGLPKVLIYCQCFNVEQSSPITDGMKAPFLDALSSANFIITFCSYDKPFDALPVPYELTNGFTGERLSLIKHNSQNGYLLIRCPISRDETKWTKWEKEAVFKTNAQRNNIFIQLGDGDIGDDFISADCWLAVFHLLTPFQLGLGIAMISRRFDYYVDEHFKTRKWALGDIWIQSKIVENGTKAMQIVNSYGKSLPIPQNPLPKKVAGFRHIYIGYIDRNVIAFLHRFRSLFDSCGITLSIANHSDCLIQLILLNIWPMLKNNIHCISMFSEGLHNFRRFAPSILSDCQSLRFFESNNVFPDFRPADSANSSDCKAIARWLLLPRPDGLPKVFIYRYRSSRRRMQVSSLIEEMKAPFFNASSPVNFIIVCRIIPFDALFMPIELTNGFTRERLSLMERNAKYLVIRCPISRNKTKWKQWEQKAIEYDLTNQLNIIHFGIHDDDIGDGLLDDGTPGPSDQQNRIVENDRSTS
ncbi:hypothetical protein niasHT_039937 [Heterodera trifolii]|uniref:F-box domain-containing protein n=1 Tax=Heterodera trifolii TaxID=157864 RepID=A0ABD2IJT4_9BILA